MPYAAEADVITRYGSDAHIMASDRNRDGQSDAESWATALDDATALIDTYIGKRYDVPLTTVPKTVVRCCVDIAMYQLSADGAVATDEQRRRYEDCMKLLDALARGTISLGLPKPPAEDPKAGHAAFSSAPRRFSRNTLRGF